MNRKVAEMKTGKSAGGCCSNVVEICQVGLKIGADSSVEVIKSGLIHDLVLHNLLVILIMSVFSYYSTPLVI